MTFEEWEDQYIKNSARSQLCPDYSYRDMKAAWLAGRKAALEEAAGLFAAGKVIQVEVPGTIYGRDAARAILALVDNNPPQVDNHPVKG